MGNCVHYIPCNNCEGPPSTDAAEDTRVDELAADERGYGLLLRLRY